MNDEIKETNYMLSYISSRTDDVLADDYVGKIADYITNLQERIDKAIEYINENWGHWCSDHCKYATETISILKGESNDKEL